MPYMTINETLAALHRAEDEYGHDLLDDSPGGISSVQRWTCQRTGCGEAILRYQGNVYGPALDAPCTAEEGSVMQP